MSNRNFFDDLSYYAGVDVGTAAEMSGPSPGGQQACPPNPNVGPGMPPRGPDLTRLPPVRLIYPPRIEKLSVSTDFQVADYELVLPTGAGATVVLAGFVIPTGQVGWLQEMSLYTLTPTGNTSAVWTVRINGQPVPGFDNIRNPPGIANLVYIGRDDMRIRVPSGNKVDILITNRNGFGPWTLGGDFAGWYHPEAAEDRAWNLNV